MTAFNGEAGQPVGLFLTSFNGTPFFLGLAIGTFDADGHYLAPTIPTRASWAGLNVGLTAVTLSAVTGIKISDEVLIPFQ